MQIDVVRLPSAGTDLQLPAMMTPGASGADVRAAVQGAISIPPREWRAIPTGLALAIPAGFEVQVRPRSGLARRHGVTVLNAPGTLDSDFRGEVEVLLINHGCEMFDVVRGMRIAQLVASAVVPAVYRAVPALPDTDRGRGGFGHTGDE